jgi:hypothetical protein
LLQSLQKRGVTGLSLSIVRGKRHERTDPPHLLALLRVRDERPCRRHAADKRDEIASPHRLPLKRSSYPTMRTVHGASQQIWITDVRFGSKADINACLRDVRFTPKSGH